MENNTIRIDGTDGTSRHNCFEDPDSNSTKTAQTGQLIAALAVSGNPRQTTRNVKITFNNFDFLKMNECK